MRKRINVLLGVSLAIGFVLMMTGDAMGAKTNMYFDSAGIHTERNWSLFGNSGYGEAGTDYEVWEAAEDDGDILREISEEISDDVRGAVAEAQEYAEAREYAAQYDDVSNTFVYDVDENLDEFESVEIDVVSMDVTVEPADYYGIDIRYPNNRKVEWSVRGGTLKVEDKTNSLRVNLFSWNQLGGGEESYVTVYCPSDALDNIHIDTVSGEVSVNGFTGMDSFEIETVSGDISAEDCEAQEIECESTSGEVSVYGSRSEYFSVASVSGDIWIDDCYGEDIKLDTVSGEITGIFDASAEDYAIRFSSVSGSMQINGERVKKNFQKDGGDYELRAGTVSGDLDITFTED
ncbi:MAG: DUF4097 domain-containing protein [Clostridiales bacterium]|jgi:DUF4097 and DUF4098 domain-containing protein YvlB|nr:DUF4097 domain-containing protein [Clostridiales bacterium]